MDEYTKKACTGCGQVKPLEAYYRRPRGKYGRASKCNACRAQYRAANREHTATQQAAYYDATREKAAKRNARWRKANRERHNQRVAAWCKANPEKGRNRNHCRRARILNAHVADVDILAVYERDKWRCGLCHKKVNRTLKWPDPMSASLDHVIPLSDGGTHEPANVQLAHLGCNAGKRNRGGGEQLALLG